MPTQFSLETNNLQCWLTRATKQEEWWCKENYFPGNKKPWKHLPCSNRHQHNVVQVEFTPLLHIMGKGSTEQSPPDQVGGAGQEDGSQLVPESWLAIFKQLVWLIHHQPLHARNREVWFARVPLVSGKVHLNQTLIPAQVYCWRIFFQQINESVGSSDQYIY